jgi:hypothetical protein
MLTRYMGVCCICAAATAPRMAVFPGSYSDSVPFLKQPTNLDGSLPGDVGFDPLGFSEVFDVKVLREAELKHGRIAMLAVLGWIVQETAPASIHPGFPTVSDYSFCLALSPKFHSFLFVEEAFPVERAPRTVS